MAEGRRPDGQLPLASLLCGTQVRKNGVRVWESEDYCDHGWAENASLGRFGLAVVG